MGRLNFSPREVERQEASMLEEEIRAVRKPSKPAGSPRERVEGSGGIGWNEEAT